MRTYDCFTFFNELELLEIRLNELDGVVDKFVLVEATLSHQGKPKPLFYELNKDRFSAFHHKLIHVVVDTYPDNTAGDAWVFEKHQRNSIINGLTECDPEDLIMISDVDEIPRPEKVLEACAYGHISLFRQQMYYYYLNCLNSTLHNAATYAWHGAVALPRGAIAHPLQEYRDVARLMSNRFHPKFVNRIYWMGRLWWELRKRGWTVRFVNNGGWHFSYLGGVDRIIQKIEAFAHTEYNSTDYKSRERIERAIANGEDIFGRDFVYRSVPIDSTFPAYVQHHPERFRHLIAPVNSAH